MEKKNIPPKGIDEYILQFDPKIQEILKTLRKVIKESAPEAEEKINYQNTKGQRDQFNFL